MKRVVAAAVDASRRRRRRRRRKGIVSAGSAASMMREQKRGRDKEGTERARERVMEIRLWKKFHASPLKPRSDITVLNPRYKGLIRLLACHAERETHCFTPQYVFVLAVAPVPTRYVIHYWVSLG